MIDLGRAEKQAGNNYKIMATSLREIYDAKVAEGALKPDAGQLRAVDALAALQTALETGGSGGGWFSFLRKPEAPPRGLYLYGGVGRGKSMVMDLFFAALGIEKKRRVHFHAFMLEVHDFLHDRRTARKKGEGDAIDGDLIACADKIAGEAKALCFDEFQVKDVADAMILGRLFTALFDRGVAVVITSNIAPGDLYENGLQRDRFIPFINLLKEKTDIVEFGGDRDYRLDRLRGLQVYFWPDDADARAELDRIFRTVADGHAGDSVNIEVKGRVIHVPRAAKEVCAFTFEELCEEAKSAVDYLELARHFRVFVLEGVPVMNDNKRNAVVRFITLIDTLYDHKARIAISAAAPPDRLYTGEDSASAFPRTVSRLMEMQSKEYGVA